MTDVTMTKSDRDAYLANSWAFASLVGHNGYSSRLQLRSKGVGRPVVALIRSLLDYYPLERYGLSGSSSSYGLDIITVVLQGFFGVK